MRAAIFLLSALSLHNQAVYADDPPPAAEMQTAAKPQFDLLDFQIDGNSVLDDESLERAVYPFLGPDKNLDDVEKARSALENAYRQAGYPSVVVAIPEQDVNEEGRVRLEVVEGRIETLHITGSQFHSLNEIRAAIPALAEGQVPHMPSVQEQMTTMAKQAADRKITPIFRAGSTPGKMEVELKVKDELPLHGSLEMNSRNTSNTTYARLIGSLRYDNLWQKHHSVSLQYQMSPENTSQVEVVTGTYVMPTGWYDTRLSLYGMSISSNTGVPGVQVGELAVVGSGTVYGLRLLKPLDVSGDDIQSLTVGFDYKSFDTTTTSNTPIAYAKFIAGYDGSWRSDISSTALNLTGNFSFRGLGNDPAQFQNKLDASNLTNPDAGALAANFMYLSGNLKNQLTLPADVLLQSRIRGQASSTFLINNEQFSVGGPLSVRGYHQSQALGDNGLNISMEIYTPKLLMSDWEKLENFRALAFAEWAGIWSRNMGLLPPQNTHFSLASTGLGLRLKMLKSLTGEFDWSYPLLAYQTQTSFVGVGQQRVDFRVLYEF